MEVRKEECKDLIDTLFEDKFAQTELGFDQAVELELDKLIVGGHSFGGMTAIAMSECDERIKATVTLDPWLWIIIEKIDNREYKVNTAQCHVLSEGFSPEVEKRMDFNTVKLLKHL